MSRTKVVVAGVVALAVAGGAGVGASWDDMPWAEEQRTCAAPAATVRTEIPLPAEGRDTPPRPLLSPDGKHLLHPAGKPVLVDVRTGRTVRSYDDAGAPSVVSFRADGSSFAAYQEVGRLPVTALWDVGRDKAIQFIHDAGSDYGLVRDVAVSPDGRTLAISTRDGSVRLWNVRSGLLVATLREKSEIDGMSRFQESGLAFSPDGRHLALADTGGEVSVWAVGSREVELKMRALGSSAFSAVFSPDGRYLAVHVYNRRQSTHQQDVWVVERATRRSVLVRGHLLDPVQVMRFSPDSASIVTVTDRGIVERTTLADEKTSTVLQVCDNPHLAVSADATTVLARVPSADRTVFEFQTYPLPDGEAQS